MTSYHIYLLSNLHSYQDLAGLMEDWQALKPVLSKHRECDAENTAEDKTIDRVGL